MRTLVILRGMPGCGKSTWVEENNLDMYTLSADNLRLLVKSPVLKADGTCGGVLGEDNYVWKLLHQLLEKRMQSGEFTVIDATHSKSNELNIYKQLASKYRYRIYCVDFSDTPLGVALERNAGRVDYKRVPGYAIKRIHDRIQSSELPSGITVVKPEEFKSVVEWSPIDLSDYEEIVHIGDIHGCATVLKECLNGGLDPNKYYVFLGDYIDRGIENKEVIEFLVSICNLPNVCLLEGNHERHLWAYSNDYDMNKDLKFCRDTIKELGESSKMKKMVRQLCRKLRQILWYTYKGQEVFCCHGGVSSLNMNPLYIPANILINGTGEYEDAELTEITFNEKHPNTIQIHGHRNVENRPTLYNKNNYNLEGKVEFGGNLRIVRLQSDLNIVCENIRNNVYEVSDFECNVEIQDVAHLLAIMRKSSIIAERQSGRISSFNFKPIAFYDSLWGGVSTKARGLFIDTELEKIIARSYDKFFNYKEMKETEPDELEKNLHFPVNAYLKENGFLGILGCDVETDKLIFCSKSTVSGEFAKLFKAIMYKHHFNKLDGIKDYLKANDCSMVFEVVDPIKDPHIVDYVDESVTLLDVIYNKVHFEKLEYGELIKVADSFGLEYKKLVKTFSTWVDLKQFIDLCSSDKSLKIEGYVLEDANEFHFKLKLPRYNILKKLRNVTEVYNKFKKYEVREDEYYKEYVVNYLALLENNKHVLADSYSKYGKVNIGYICKGIGFSL